MKTILVTGANGQLGNELRILSLSSSYRFVFTDISELDITSKDKISAAWERHKPDYCINTAAYTSVDQAEQNEKAATEINVKGAGNLAQACKDYGIGLVHISTDFVFDGRSNIPYRETDQTNPLGIYGKTKLEGEKSVQKIHPDSIILRTSWLYSSFGHNFVKTMIKLAGSNNITRVVYDQLGTPTFARDMACLILNIIDHIENKQQKISGLYHYSSEGVASWYDFAWEIFNYLNKKEYIIPVLSEEYPTPAKRPSYSVLDKSAIKNILSIEIPYWKYSLYSCLEKILT